jgi:hypothetical protein
MANTDSSFIAYVPFIDGGRDWFYLKAEIKAGTFNPIDVYDYAKMQKEIEENKKQ